jgi:hypothetical protein
MSGKTFREGSHEIRIPGQGLRLFYARQVSKNVPYHLFGGKRISELWSESNRRLVISLYAPPGLKETVLVDAADRGIEEIIVDGKPGKFFLDSSCGIAHGVVSFSKYPVTVEVKFSSESLSKLSTKGISPDNLTMQYLRKKQP